MFVELKHTLRSLLKARGLTAVVMITLALGIGASCAIFSVVNTVFLRPLPYAQPEQLTRICQSPGCFWISPPEFFDLKRETKAWSAIEAWINTGVNIGTASEPARVTASFVTGGMFDALGREVAMGRRITPQDAMVGAAPVAVISHGLWQRAFGGQADIVGREVLINGRASVIIGVMPRGFEFPMEGPDTAEIWAPLQLDPANPGLRDSKYLNVIARLNPQVTLRQAQSELEAVTLDWKQRFPTIQASSLTVRGLHDELVGGIRPALRMLMTAVCFLLLIACMNVANLLLARAESRQSETSIRVALGAGLWRLARQFVSEGLVLSVAGAAIGLLLAFGGLELIRSLGGTGIPRASELSIDGRVVYFALGMSVLTGLIFGLAPLIHAAKHNLQGAMKSSAAATTDAGGAQRFRQALVVSQLALALILLTGTGLMLRAFWNLQEVHGGFDPRGVITLPVAMPARIANPDFAVRVENRLAELPGVESAALSTVLPPVSTAPYRGVALDIEGFKPIEKGAMPVFTVLGRPMAGIDFYHSISKDYFSTLRIPLVEGRFFDARDSAQAAKVAILNQTTARALWGNESAIGHRVRHPSEEEWRTVVGVVADVKNDGLEKPTATAIYLPYAQPAPYFESDIVYLVLRSRSDPALLVNAARREINQINPALPVLKARTLEEVVSASQSRPKFLTVLLGLFSGVALVLASIGIYGVISYSVAQRTREFGIRMALGARQGAVIGLVLKTGLLLTVCGLLAGLVGAFGLTRFLSSFLFGVTATDPATFVGVSTVLAAIAILATYIPARRATQVDPLVALRTE